MSHVVHFEIHASEPNRLITFYSKLLGWKFESWGPPGTYWVIRAEQTSEDRADGGLLPRHGATPTTGQPVNSFVCTVDVTSLDASIAQLTDLGGSLAVPKMAVPGVGWVAYGKDPDGNLFGMLQPDAAAA